MENILTKFDDIKIENDTRIAIDDLSFCESNQKLYLKILENYKNIYKDLIKVSEKEKTQFSEIESENSYIKNGYTYKKYDYHFVSINKEDFTKTIIGVHRIFITTIFNYFVEKYGVKLDVKSVNELLGLEEPIKTNDGYWLPRNITEEEVEKIRKKNTEYEERLDEYRDAIIAAKIDFNTIIDNIFIQLDGYSFVDRVKKEIIDDCKEACFNKYNGTNYAELKNDKVVINTGFYSHYDNIWKRYEASTDNKTFKAILRALSFFDSNEKNNSIYNGWSLSFIYYNKNEQDNIYGLHYTYGKKVVSFKFYKNGKWEIKFTSQDEAQKFYEDYCK